MNDPTVQPLPEWAVWVAGVMVLGALVALVVIAVVLLRNRRRQGPPPERFRCGHQDRLCDKYGCPDDPSWSGDRR